MQNRLHAFPRACISNAADNDYRCTTASLSKDDPGRTGNHVPQCHVLPCGAGLVGEAQWGDASGADGRAHNPGRYWASGDVGLGCARPIPDGTQDRGRRAVTNGEDVPT